MSDGTNLIVEVNEGEQPIRGQVLIVHGLAEYKERYNHLVKFLNENNYRTIRYDQRGHGDSEGERVYFNERDTLFKDLYEVVQFINKDKLDAPLFILGHSMGGFTVAGFAVEHPNMVDGLILSGAMTYNSSGKLKPIPKWVPGKIKIPGNFAGLQAHKISHDLEIVTNYKNDPKVIKHVTVGLVRGFYKGVEVIKEKCSKFNDPVLILHGSDDLLVSVEDSKWLYNNISSNDKDIKIYDGLYHEILNEIQKEQVMEDILEWLNLRTTV